MLVSESQTGKEITGINDLETWNFVKAALLCRLQLHYILFAMIKRRLSSSGSSGRAAGGEARNMKSICPPLVEIFFMTIFYRARRPLGPPGSSTAFLFGRNIEIPFIFQVKQCTVNSKSLVGKVLLRINWKFE